MSTPHKPKRLCTICARGGSKGVPGKNVMPFLGKPLIAWSIQQARESSLFELIVVSTDSSAIAEAALLAGADLIIDRPADMATDTAAKVPAILHALLAAESASGQHFDTLVDLDATAPTRLAEDIIGAVALLETTGAPSVITGNAAYRSPYFDLVEQRADGTVGLAKVPTTEIVRRQDVPICFDMNASIYVWTTARFRTEPAVFYAETRLFEMPAERSREIDSPFDVEMAKGMMRAMQTPQAAPRSEVNARHVVDFTASNAHRANVHDVIPGGAHTYSKGDDQFPALAPAAIKRGKHGRVWDIDGNEYVDVTLGLGSVNLGHAYEPVLSAVRDELENGVNFQRPSPLEMEVGEAFLALTPGMDRIKYAKNGSNVTTAAVKLARAFTGRPLVAMPASHPFYSFDDWFIGKTMVQNGIPEDIKHLSLHYDSLDPDSLAALFNRHPGQIACVITEPVEMIPIDAQKLHAVQRLAKDNGALFIVDEMLSGFRAGLPGEYTNLGLEPDMATWGKGIGNGFSFCALTGRADIMELGGIRQLAQPRVFLLSSTHGGETHALAAALAVIDTYKRHDVIGRLNALVAQFACETRAIVNELGLAEHIVQHAASWRVFHLFKDANGAVSSSMRTLFLQEMIGRGVLYQGVFLACFTHTAKDMAQVLAAFRAACGIYKQALDSTPGDYLVGAPTRPVFRKYNGCAGVCPSAPCPNEHVCKAQG